MADMTTKILAVELKADDAVNGIIKLNDAISKNNQQIKDNSALIKQNNKAIADGTGDVMKLTAQNQVLAKSNVELTAKTKVLKDERRLLEKETRNEIKAETEEKGSLRALQAELSNLTLKFNKLGQAERENGVEGKKLKTQINAITNEIKAAEFETQRYYRNVGNYQASILSAIGLNNQFATSIITIAGSGKGVQGAFMAMSAGVKAFGRSCLALMTNPAFLAIAGIAGAGMAFKWFYDYNQGVAEATRLTREFTHLAGDDLENLRISIQATANTYGKEYKETLEGVDVLMSHFHLSAQEAMDVINGGFQAGADLNGDMLQKIQQYAPAFHDAGLSASELVVLIQKTRSGIFSQQGLDAIRMGSARIREMSSTTRQALQRIGIDTDDMLAKLRSGQMKTFEALQIVSQHLKAMPNDAQEVGEVMTAVFGRQGKFAAQEMIEGFSDMNLSLEDAKKETGAYGEQVDVLREKEEQLQQGISDVFSVTGQGFEETQNNVKIFAKDWQIYIINKLRDCVQWLANVWNNVKIVRVGVAYLIGVWRVLFNVAWAGFRMIISAIKAVGDMLVKLSGSLNAIRKNIARAFDGIADIFKGIKNMDPSQVEAGLRKAVSGGWDAVKGFGEAVVKTFQAGITSIGGSWGGMIDDMTSSFNHLGDVVDYRFAGMSDAASSVGGGGSGSASGGGGGSSGGSSGSGGGGGSRGGGGSSGSGSSGRSNPDNDAEQERRRILGLAKQLMGEVEQLHERAMREASKISEDGINAMFDKQKQALQDRYDQLLESSSQFSQEELNNLASAQVELLQNLEKERQKAIIDFRTAQANQLLQNQIDAEKDAKRRHELQLQQLENQKQAELDKATESEELRTSIEEKYAAKRLELTKKFAKEQLDEQERFYQTMMDGQKEDEQGRLARYNFNSQLIALQMQQELAQYEGNEAMKLAIKEKYLRMQEQLDREYADKERELQYQRYETIATITGGLGELMGEFADDNRAAAVASKVLALGQIMVSQAVAIANAVKAGSNAVNPWQMIAQIAASVTAVTVAMVQAFKSLNQAKFATGGYVEGAGTSTSDSIPVRVSNGESIMNAETTAMFGGLLSSLNQLGGGVPIQVQETATSVKGEDMLARAVARGVAMLPAPVVSVEDINRGQRQVEVMNERATI